MENYEDFIKKHEIFAENRKRKDRKRDVVEKAEAVVTLGLGILTSIVALLVLMFLIGAFSCGCIFVFRELVRLA